MDPLSPEPCIITARQDHPLCKLMAKNKRGNSDTDNAVESRTMADAIQQNAMYLITFQVEQL